MRLSRESNPGHPCTAGEHSIKSASRTALLTAIRNLGLYYYSLIISVPDPWHIGVDPDPRIHAADYWMDPDADPDFTLFSKKKSKISHKTVGIKVFYTFFTWWWRIRDTDYNSLWFSHFCLTRGVYVNRRVINTVYIICRYIGEDVERQWKQHNPDGQDTISWATYRYSQ
jgi:hypothetical protein